MSSPRPILIVGAGIAGLAAAVGLAKAGFGSRVFERRPAPTEAGAGIQIGPNGVRALAALGLREAAERVAFRPQGLVMRQGATGLSLTRLPWGAAAEQRYGAPFLTVLRTELHSVLLAAARASPAIELVTGFEVAAIDAETISIQSENGRTERGAAIIGADGLWSRLRSAVAPAEPVAAGYTAYRAVIARAGLPAPFDAPEVGLWIGREAHVVHYPVRGGGLLNIVVVVGGGAASRNWDESGAVTEFAPHLASWPSGLRGLLEHAPEWRRWTLFDMPDLTRWANGAVALTGDAAHPVLPFLAQGAVMALEDAAALARVVNVHGAPSPQALAAYAAARGPRVRKLAAASRANGRTYHLTGAAGAARDLVLRTASPAWLMGRYDWLYDYRPEAGISRAEPGL